MIMKVIHATFALVLLFSGLTIGLKAQSISLPPSSEPAESKPKGVTVAKAVGVNISGPTTVCKGGETILKAEGDYESFEWNTGVKDRFLHVREEGTYEVTAITKGGCRFTTSVTVRMIPCT